MPIVHCPRCDRALNLPESADISSARCPLCQTEFPVEPSAAIPSGPPPPNIPPVPRFVVRETGSEVPDSPLDSLPPGYDEDAPPVVVSDGAVESACWWMRGAGAANLVQLFCCAWVSLGVVSGYEFAGVAYCGCYLVQVVVGLMLVTAPMELRKVPMSLGFVGALGLLALLMGVLTLIASIPLALHTTDVFTQQVFQGEFGLLVACLINLFVVLVSLVAGIKTILLAKREQARREATRERPNA